jgi:hypothetical protein
MARHIDSKAFLKVFNDELTNYYSYYYKELLNIHEEIDKKIIQDYLRDIMKLRDQRSEFMKNLLARSESLLNLLKKTYKLPKDDFIKTKDRYLYVVKESLSSSRSGIDFLREIFKYKDIVIPLYRAYRTVFGTGVSNNFAYQELYEPSEVICIYSEGSMPREKINASFALIK